MKSNDYHQDSVEMNIVILVQITRMQLAMCFIYIVTMKCISYLFFLIVTLCHVNTKWLHFMASCQHQMIQYFSTCPLPLTCYTMQ